MNASAAKFLRRSMTASRILRGHLRAQALRLQFPGASVHRHARLGRGARVHVSEGGSLVLGPCAIAENVSIQVAQGARVVLGGRFIGPNSLIVSRKSITVDSGAMIAEMCVLRDSDHVRDEEGSISDIEYTSGAIVVGRDVWLSSGVVVLKGVEIGPGATVGAGAVVTRSLPARSTSVGVPARVVRQGSGQTGSRRAHPDVV